MAKHHRETMPDCTVFIDEMRAAFGAEEINASIKAGINGQPTFWASENGVETGTQDTRRGITLDKMVIGPLVTSAQAGRGGKC